MGSIGMGSVVNESSYKDTILQSNYRKMTIKWSFTYSSFVKFHGKKWEPQYPNLRFKEVCYKGTALGM